MARHWHVARTLGTAPLHHCGTLLLGSALLLPGCSPRNDGIEATTHAAAAMVAPLAFTVNGVQSTHRLATSTMESKEATAGNRFVVLDVSVTNPGADPQALVEGKLVAMSESDVQSFDTPVTLLSDDYLSMQVLRPGQGVRGKVAYEVPEDLPGVLYWIPGSGGQRVLLHPNQTQVRTLADAGLDDTIQPSRTDPSAVVRHAAVRLPASKAGRSAVATTPMPSEAIALPGPDAWAPLAVASAARSPHVERGAPAPMRSGMDVVATAHVIPPPTVDAGDAASLHKPMPVPAPTVATIAPLSPMDRFVARWVPPTPSPSGPAGDQEHIRQLACQGLVARNDPWEKSNNLGFFRASCQDFAMPSRWQPGAEHSVMGRISAAVAGHARTAMAGHAPACDSASRASRVVCGDAVLSALDIQLEQSVQRAGRYVSPIALQRDQEHWTGRVRNACETAACLQQAYLRQQVKIDALIPAAP